MTILAVYYTVADIILLGQCFYYRGFRLSDEPAKAAPKAPLDEEATEESPLLSSDGQARDASRLQFGDTDRRRRSSATSSFRTRLTNVDGIPAPSAKDSPAAQKLKPASTLASIVFNVTALVLVCAAGVFGWWLSVRNSQSSYRSFDFYSHHGHHSDSEYMKAEEADVSFDLWGQIFGYLCAALYLGSRIPQLLLNYRRKSTEGVSMLFFLFACVGNLTYVLSIFAYEPGCAKSNGAASPLRLVETLTKGMFCTEGEWSREYGRYILMNASWLAGSAGTLFLDMGIFVQFWIYRGREAGRVD